MWADLTSEEFIPFSAMSPGLKNLVLDSSLTVVDGYNSRSLPKRKV
jgi:hypothetical protein